MTDLLIQQQAWKTILFNGLKTELMNAVLAKQSPTFINKTNLAINFETFQQQGFGFHKMVTQLVLPGKTAKLASNNGEWYLNTYFNLELCKNWILAGYTPGFRVGKFRDLPCAMGNYSWMDEDGLDIIYDPVKRTATFIKL